MIRVLHLLSSLNIGGLEKRLISLLEVIPRDRIAMDIVCKGPTTGIMAPRAEELGAKVYHCRMTPFQIGFARRLAQIIRRGNYDIVHNHLGAFGGVAVWMAHRRGARVITSFVGTCQLITRWSSQPILKQLNSVYTHLNIRYAINHSDLVTGVSRGVLDAIVPDHLSRSNCIVLHSGVALNSPSTMQESVTLRQELGLPAAAPIVLHVGRFTWEKNHLGLLAIFQEVLKSVPQARMLLVGAGPLQSKVKNAIIECGLENNAILLGMRNDVPRLMRCCQVLLHPSFFEGLPVTVLEAMSAGLPVVASDIPGIRAEVIESGHSGFLHSVNEPLAMAQSISQLLLNPALAAKIGQTGRTIVENHFSLAATANRYITLYENCMLQKPDIIPTSMPTRHSSRTIDAGRQSLKSF